MHYFESGFSWKVERSGGVNEKVSLENFSRCGGDLPHLGNLIPLGRYDCFVKFYVFEYVELFGEIAKVLEDFLSTTEVFRPPAKSDYVIQLQWSLGIRVTRYKGHLGIKVKFKSPDFFF